MRDRDVSPTPRLKNTAEREVVCVEMRRRGDEETRRNISEASTSMHPRLL